MAGQIQDGGFSDFSGYVFVSVSVGGKKRFVAGNVYHAGKTAGKLIDPL